MEKKVRVTFSLGHLYPDEQITGTCKKSEIEEYGWYYLQDKRKEKGSVGKRAKEMIFPYFYQHPPIKR